MNPLADSPDQTEHIEAADKPAAQEQAADTLAVQAVNKLAGPVSAEQAEAEQAELAVPEPAAWVEAAQPEAVLHSSHKISLRWYMLRN